MEHSFFDILKVIFLLPFLLYASYLDFKYRKVPNKIWKIILLYGYPFLILDLLLNTLYQTSFWLLNFLVMFIVVYLFNHFDYFGGADAKCMLIIALFIPYYPYYTGFLPFPFYILWGSVLLSLIYSYLDFFLRSGTFTKQPFIVHITIMYIFALLYGLFTI